MKYLIFVLIGSFLISASMAQNGGQYPENNSLKLEYLGGGKIKITNKQSCESIVAVNDSKTEANITIPGNSSYIYLLPSSLISNIRFKAKNTTNCGSSDYGYVELFLASLPLKFISFTTTHISNTEFLVNFEVGEIQNVKQFNIQASTNGINYRTVTILFPDDLQPNKKYAVKINLSKTKNN